MSSPDALQRAGLPCRHGSSGRRFGNLTSHTNLPIRADLEAAGIARRDGDGRVVDFHALGHSYMNALAMSPAR